MRKEEICSILKKFMRSFPQDSFCEEDMYPCFIEYLPQTFYSEWASGATKCIVLNHKWDFVIKVPLTGGFYYDGYEDEDGDWHDEESYNEFLNANDLPMMTSENSCWDYCNAEAAIWDYAEEQGFSEFLAKTEYVGDLYGHPIYVQEKVKPFDFPEYNEEYDKFCMDICESLDCFYLNGYWLTDALNYYGYEKLYRFLKFIKENHLNHDLHSGNIGYIGNKPVLLDYCGWRS